MGWITYSFYNNCERCDTQSVHECTLDEYIYEDYNICELYRSGRGANFSISMVPEITLSCEPTRNCDSHTDCELDRSCDSLKSCDDWDTRMSCASCEATQNCVTTQNCDSTQNNE